MRIHIVCATSILLLTSMSGVAFGKDDSDPRGYAVISGPGLRHPIVFSAPFDLSKGGYYGSDAERLLGLANNTGATPAGTVHEEGGAYRDGVLPLDTPLTGQHGPRYRLTWHRDGSKLVAVQELYPFQDGLPLVYTYPSSRKALIGLFGRFQDPAHLWTGWGRSTSDALEVMFRANGLRTTVDDATGTVEIVSPSASPAVQGTSVTAQSPVDLQDEDRRVLGIAVAILAGIAALVLWHRRRVLPKP